MDVDYSIKQAGGIIIQVLPDAKDEAVDELEERLKDFGNLTDKLDKGQSIEYVIESLLGEVEYMEQTAVTFVCDCNKDRMERALLSVGKKDLQEMADEDGQAELVCPFCNDQYVFTKDELEDMIKYLDK